ncbi:DUF2958 domain-containing protein [Sphingomonas sabuli]|uniref:DUF2958 domain-containing protein n=1 Tax=Sphingomonas sabuli TaxID=2764186 RepID=A0A7G9L3W2_9SPHN|nr:DUF2958 domain-containing protein [Sphingomonas sabuli]QNM83311.1 DUF2958 domain-containing protein [Sphingomonas sabuli]
MTASSLLTADHLRRLRENARTPVTDHPPVVKLFNPAGAATWLVTELAEDDDTLFGLADLGFGFPELGSFSLSELRSLRLPFGLQIERDLSFSTRFGLSVWAEAARSSGSIGGAEKVLAAAAAAATDASG